MKKIYLILLVVFMTSISSSVSAIGISIKVDFGKRTAEGNCGPGFGVCSITIGGTLSVAQQSDGNFQISEANAEMKDGKLVVMIPKGINEKGKNERGQVVVTIQKPMVIDQNVAKQLGVPGLVISPGTYEFKNNTFTFSVKGPRDVASGMATGKR